MAELNYPDPAAENPWVDPSGAVWDHDGDGWIRSKKDGGNPPSDDILYGRDPGIWTPIDVLEASADGDEYLRVDGGWQVLETPPAQALTQAGEMFWFAGSTAPAGSLPCDGQGVGLALYDKLYAAIGDLWATTGGALPPGAGNFRLPPQVLGGFGLYYRYGNNVGSYHANQNEAHTHNATHNHSGSVDSDGEHSHDIGIGDSLVTDGGGSDPIVDNFGSGSSSEAVSSAGDHGHSLTIDPKNFSTGTRGTSDARPSSVVMLRCIWTGDI